MKKIIFIIVTALFFLSSCGLVDKIKELIGVTVPNATEQAVAVLDRGINELGVASANWQDILNKVISDLPDEIQSTIKTEVSNLLQRGIATTGAELRCNVDFLRIRMRQGLQRVKAHLLGTEIPPLEPQLCQIIPSAIDMSLEANRRNKIEFFGYDFDSTEINIILIEGNHEVDISNYLDKPTHYNMTLNLGFSGVQLTPQSRRIILRWDGRSISTIGIIQPSPDICETKFINFTVPNVSVIPYHSKKPGKNKGDKEFSGHGPSMYCSVRLINESNKIRAKVYVTASETKSDWTYGKRTKYFTIYNADPGYVIEEIVTSKYASYSYTDNDHALDVFAGSGPVEKYIFNGDGPGSDIGTNTKVEIQFNPIRVQLKQTGDCVSSAMIRSIQIQGLISPVLVNRMHASHLRFLAPSETGTMEIIRIDTIHN